jgi:SAP domain-containing new25/Domain of unknown function (DUF6434)
MASARPALNARLAASTFRRWYWLKAELTLFCRSVGLPTAGSKPDLAARIEAFLAKQPLPQVVRAVRHAAMPDTFTLATVIEPGWRCGPTLGQFLRTQCGPGFRFNAVTRNFIHTQVGKTLADAVACYRASVVPGAPKPPIIAQNEYNQHMRDFYASNPSATHEQVLKAWHLRRGQPWT